MNFISLFTPYLGKLKWFAPVFMVSVLTYMMCLRWPTTFNPWYKYVGITTGIAILVVLVIILVKRTHHKKMAAGLEAGLSEQEEGQVDLRGEIKALRENWQASLDKLKASRMGKANKAMLFQLPWYIILGEPASGKSTLLRKSGLDFPVGDAAVAGLHGTRNCDWWFANEAVFLDTAGRYVMETQEAEWVAFLDLLKKYRTKKPINGVLVALPANSLLTKTHDELLQDGKRIRSRIDELIEHLGINFPIYVLVTKCDLVSGFVEFFGSLDQRYGEQMVGWTNPADAEARFDKDTFGQRFDEVSGRLFRMRPWLESTAKKRDLMKAFLYPEEFMYLGEPVREVLDVVFRANVYQETPVCRGVYFSSGTQVGSPLARTLEEMAKDLNIPAGFDMGVEMEEEKEVRAYFIKDLVAEQILKDKEMTWRTWRAEQKTRKKRLGWGLVGLGIVALAALLSIFSFMKNTDRLTAFEVSIEEKALPLEAGIGCLNTRDKAVRPGLMDVGLNFSDELIPSMNRSFKRVFGDGCVQAMLDKFEKIAKAGIQTKVIKGRKYPDVYSYLIAYGHFHYLRDGIRGGLEPETKEWEKGHLEVLFPMLVDRKAAERSRSDNDDLRRSLYEFGGDASLDYFTPLVPDIADEFDRHLLRWLGDVNDWVQKNKDASGMAAGDIAKSLNALKEACRRHRKDVIPHQKVRTVFEIAETIRDAAYADAGSTAPGAKKPLEALSFNIFTAADLTNQLVTAKELSNPEGKVPPTVDALVPQLGKPGSSKEMGKKRQAQAGIMGYLERIISDKVPRTSYDRDPSRDGLSRRRSEITAAVTRAGQDAWTQVQANVLTIEGRNILTPQPDGTMKREEGWWETLVDLALAKQADALQNEYLEQGLTRFLGGDRWKVDRMSDTPEEIYTKDRITKLILPQLLDAQEFFGNRELAGEVKKSAQGALEKGLTDYLTEMEETWLERFEREIPEAPATTLEDLYKHLDMWSARRSPLLAACREIRAAVYDVRKLHDDQEDITFLRASENARESLIDLFLVCLDDEEDEKVRTAMTVVAAEDELKPLQSAIAPVAGGMGADKAEARKLLGELVKGRGQASPFTRALEAIKEIKALGSRDEPAGLLAAWMEPGLKVGWDQLVELTAQDINAEWSRLINDWRPRLKQGGREEEKVIFDRGGELDSFLDAYMKPFFDIPGYRTRLTQPGAKLQAEAAFTRIRDKVSTLDTSVFNRDGTYVNQRMTVVLGLGGSLLAESLKVEYRSQRGNTMTPEFRNDLPIKVDLDWSPNVCLGLRFVVDLGGGDMRELSWDGPWAVAKACMAAKKVGKKYIWSQTEGGQEWEVHLTITGQTTLIDRYIRSGGAVGGGGGGTFKGSLPPRAVRVVK